MAEAAPVTEVGNEAGHASDALRLDFGKGHFNVRNVEVFAREVEVVLLVHRSLVVLLLLKLN
jgi:hypothetical protein